MKALPSICLIDAIEDNSARRVQVTCSSDWHRFCNAYAAFMYDGDADMIPGEILAEPGEIELNAGLVRTVLGHQTPQTSRV